MFNTHKNAAIRKDPQISPNQSGKILKKLRTQEEVGEDAVREAEEESAGAVAEDLESTMIMSKNKTRMREDNLHHLMSEILETRHTEVAQESVETVVVQEKEVVNDSISQTLNTTANLGLITIEKEIKDLTDPITASRWKETTKTDLEVSVVAECVEHAE